MEEKELRTALGSLYDDTLDAVVLYGVDGRIVAINEAASLLVGFRADELIGKTYREQVRIGDEERVGVAFRAALAGGTDHFDLSVRHKDGSIVPIEVYAFPARAKGRIVGVFAQARDLLALRAAEESLNANQQKFRSLFEFHPDGIMEVKPSGTISRVNVAFENETGLLSEQLVGKRWTILVAPDTRSEAERAFLAALDGEAEEMDSLLLDHNENSIEVQLKLVPLRAAGGVNGAYAIFKNVALQKAAERTIELQSERIRKLYLVAASRAESVDSQIGATLDLAIELFGFERARIARYGSGVVEPVFEERLRGGEALVTHGAAIGIPLQVGGEAFGALVFESGNGHERTIGSLERDLLQLMALFVVAALERQQHIDRIEHLAFNDALTGLPNRFLFNDRIANTLATAKRYGGKFAVMFVDLDAFKSINDGHGHAAGDAVLVEVANRLRGSLRESDTVARFGGDEFVIVQPRITSHFAADEVARKLHAILQEPVRLNGIELDAHASIGVALYPQDGLTTDELLKAADGALYRAKEGGRNRWCFASTAAQELREELSRHVNDR